MLFAFGTGIRLKGCPASIRFTFAGGSFRRGLPTIAVGAGKLPSKPAVRPLTTSYK